MAGLGGSTSHVTLTEVTNSSRNRSNSAFVPELWSDEILAAYKANLVMPQLVNVMNFVGKKGDTVRLPTPTRGSASAKAAETMVTLIANQETAKNYIIDQHWEYSRFIEDIVSVQALDSLRRFYTDDAGYALAVRVDTELHQEGAKFAATDASPTVEGSNYSKAIIGTPTSGALVTWDPTGVGNAASITDEGLRLALKELDDNNVSGMGRYLVIPPVEKAKLLGIARFTEQAFVGEVGGANSIRNGRVGSLYGVEIYVSTQCENVADAGTNHARSRAALLFQKDALVLIEQVRPRSQSQYKLEFLGDLLVNDVIFGTGVLRPEAGIAIVVPA